MGQARLRGTREERVAQAAERARREELEARERRRLIAQRERERQFAIVKDRIESRHLTKAVTRYAPRRSAGSQRRVSLLIPMILAMSASIGGQKP